MENGGGAVAQPVLGRAADIYSLGFGYAVAGVLYAIQLPFVWAVRRMRITEDTVSVTPEADDLA